MDNLPAAVTVMDETFFTAQRRHRRTARLYSVLAAFAALLQGIPLAIILAPVFLGAAVLVTDVVNLWHPAPNLGEWIGSAFSGLQTEDVTVTETGALERAPATNGTEQATDPLLLVLLLVLPGLLAMLLLWWVVRRFLIRDGLGGILLAAGARPPNRADDEEHQLVNVVEEIAIAARIQPPRVLILPADVPNAAAFGRSSERWTIAVSRGLLDDLDRDATQGVIAHLVGSVGNGDLRMQHSLLALYVSHQLAQDIISVPFARQSRRRVGLAGRMLRGKASPEEEASILRRLLTEADEDTNNFVLNFNYLTFKIVQFYTNIFVVGGILTLPFRVRRYLADATAVELTRNPDGVGRALVHLQDHRSNLPGAGFAAIYTVTAASPSQSEDSVEEALVLPASLHPPLHKRVERLHRLGFARPRRQADDAGRRPRGTVGRDWPAPLRWLVAIPVFALLAAVGIPLVVMLACMVVVGICLSMFLGFVFWTVVTGVVVAPLHAILRSLA